MKYLNDWHKRKERHSAFWQGELLDRCLCSVTSVKDNGHFADFPLPDDPEGRKAWWTDGTQIITRNLQWFENTYYGGDALPILIHDLGPAGHAGYFEGVVPRFENTVWFESRFQSYEEMAFDPESFMYKKTLDLAKQYTSAAKGDFLVSMPDAVGAADVLSHIRTPQVLLMDMIESPESVMTGIKKVQKVWEKVYAEMYDIVLANNDGGSSVGWLGTWAPGRLGQLQCDLSVMISPALFDEIIMYELETQARWLDFSLYHLDGQQQVRHLDSILSIKELDAIQWTNVAGQPEVTHFIPELKRIQKAGKGLILHVHPEEIQILMDELSSRGLYLLTYTNCQQDADDLVKQIEKMTRE